ncbi:MAG: hypothetical protein JHC98_06365 [Thermoleophilaceae bacterium]|nr:hypothetical protein [Thermoleophilaceae bacterium]
MRDRMLHDSLRALTDDAARLLEDLLSAGAEIPFEVGDAGQEPPGSKGSVTMFAYRPLTAEFVSSHADQLRSLPTFENAAHNLARTRGVIAYLRVRNEPVLDVGELTHARLGVLAFLSSVWQDAERFEYWGDRFERAYSELESISLAERLVTTVFIPVHGVALTEGSINLGAGVELIAAEELEPACADRFSDASEGADCFCSISVAAPSDAATPMPAIRLSARALLTALRLFRPGSVALGMTAQADIAGSWHQVSMPFSGRSREDAWLLRPSDEEELRQFVNAVRRVERRTRIAWALKRFETGLERTVPAEGLTDFLLALRALLQAEDDRGKAALPARVSALCAQDAERIRVREEVEAAFALERLAIDGQVGRADRKRLEKLAPLDVIAGAERHLRALLHDLVCGYLATDLKSLADEILTADGEPAGIEIVAEDPVYLEPVPDPGAPPATDPTQTVEFEAVFDDTAEISAIDLREEEPEADFGAPTGDAGENVWTLRPAAEIAPAPEVTEEPSPEMHALADELAQKFDAGLNGTMASMEFDMLPPERDDTPIAQAEPEPFVAAGPEPAMEDIVVVPEWEASPERKPVTEHTHIDTGTTSGFTFDFKKVDTPEPPAPGASKITPPETEVGAGAPDFPIPEFGVPIGRGPAAARSDDEVDGQAQHSNFREIMDENFQHPARPADEAVTTPVGRDGRPHLVALDSEPEQAAPRIVHPGQVEQPLIPLDPDMTVEYDVLSAETSAEETAQLAWSQQFLGNRNEQQPVDQEPENEVEPEPEPAPAPRLLPPVRPVPDLVLATFPEPAEEVEPQGHRSENERDHRIGPATIEFRPVVDPDTDDPDDFAGAV